MENHKEKLLSDLKNHIDVVRSVIGQKLKEVKAFANMSLTDVRRMPQSDQLVYMDLRVGAQKRVTELSQLEGSPYFTKCEIIDEHGEEKNYYFAKYEFSNESIYSWVAPVSVIRFENPGVVSYKVPDGTMRTITIKHKEQYMIVDGKVIFFAQESPNKPRELIYQEHFTKQKSDFALPEIVAQIEKAQDQVIRAHYKGPLVISGPAGSGKTTLALHRVAYLMQAPDTAELYPTRSTIVFVQDNGTKEYFSKLLPGLGIYDVVITTFSQWAFEILGISDCIHVDRYGTLEEERDMYEYQKLQTVRENKQIPWGKNIFTTLHNVYSKNFSKSNLVLFQKQKSEKKIDRFDLTILLQAFLNKNKKFEIKREYNTFVKDNLVKKVRKTSIEYPLMIVDEFQNYLPEQLRIFNHCLVPETQSIIYVGDMAQQVKLGTIKNWVDIGESILPERNIRLNKVYRNTKNILEYIQSLGYDIEIPIGVKDGPKVLEKTTNGFVDEIKHIKEYIESYKHGTIGIIAKDELYLEVFKNEFSGVKNIHVLTMAESQGVEFDLVCIVGFNQSSLIDGRYKDISSDHIKERERIQKDLLYVALTRAITELHVLKLNH
ncbi:MAG: UvrD-helicase domain-containing protein [bacterium]